MATPATLAGVQELADWIGEPIATESAEFKRAQMCLRIASALVRRESGQTWLADGGVLQDPVPEDAVMVTLYCAGRVYDNREAQTRGSIDDYDGSWKVDESGAYLTASEKRMLARFKSSGMGGIGSIATTRESSPAPLNGWVPTPTPDVFFPWY